MMGYPVVQVEKYLIMVKISSLVHHVADGGEHGIPELAEYPGSALDAVVAAAVELAHLVEQVLVPAGRMRQVHGVDCEK